LKMGFCIGGLTRSFNLSPRKPFALFTAHITSYPGLLRTGSQELDRFAYAGLRVFRRNGGSGGAG
jgi:hypothetical protein